MPEQLGLTFDAKYTVEQLWEELGDLIREYVREVSPKELAYVLDKAPTEIRDAAHERDRKSFKAKGLLAAALMARGSGVSGNITRFFAKVEGLTVLDEEPRLTPEELAKRLEDKLRRFGDAGQAAIEEAYGRRRGG